MWTWDELKVYMGSGENLLESEERHVAVLVARAMHAQRLAAVEAPAAPVVDPVVDFLRVLLVSRISTNLYETRIFKAVR